MSDGPFRYICIVCNAVWWFTKPLQLNIMRCPWCNTTVEARPFEVKEEEKHVVKDENPEPTIN